MRTKSLDGSSPAHKLISRRFLSTIRTLMRLLLIVATKIRRSRRSRRRRKRWGWSATNTIAKWRHQPPPNNTTITTSLPCYHLNNLHHCRCFFHQHQWRQHPKVLGREEREERERESEHGTTGAIQLTFPLLFLAPLHPSNKANNSFINLFSSNLATVVRPPDRSLIIKNRWFIYIISSVYFLSFDKKN